MISFKAYQSEQRYKRDLATRLTEDDAKYQETTNTNLIAGFQKAHLASLPWQTFNVEAYHMTPKIPKMCNMAETQCNGHALRSNICSVALKFI